jgi:4-oxalocrotonate tautomerase
MVAVRKEAEMPHVILKMYAGRTEDQKSRLATALTRAVTESLGLGEDSVSVSIEEFARADWMKKVYEPDIRARPDTLYKKPGYTSSD